MHHGAYGFHNVWSKLFINLLIFELIPGYRDELRAEMVKFIIVFKWMIWQAHIKLEFIDVNYVLSHLQTLFCITSFQLTFSASKVTLLGSFKYLVPNPCVIELSKQWIDNSPFNARIVLVST